MYDYCGYAIIFILQYLHSDKMIVDLSFIFKRWIYLDWQAYTNIRLGTYIMANILSKDQ